MVNKSLDIRNLRYFDSSKKQRGIGLIVSSVKMISIHVNMMSVSAIRVIFSRKVSQNVNFCCDFSGVTHTYFKTQRPNYFSSNPIIYSDKNAGTRLHVFVVLLR